MVCIPMKAPQHKPLVLLTTARSGSTPVYHILKSYLAQNKGLQGADLILNPYFGSYCTKQARLHFDPTKNTFPGSSLEKACMNRQRLVRKYHKKIFFRLFPHEMHGEFGKWMIENYDFITHERQNLSEQVLSYLISSNVQIWYRPKGIKLPRNSIAAKRSDFSAIEGSILVFGKLKHFLEPKISFTHENFMKYKAETLLKKAGLKESFDSSVLSLPIKQNPGSKLELFSNSKEIKKWYNNSRLSEISPWKVT